MKKLIDIEINLKTWLELYASQQLRKGNFETKTAVYNEVIRNGLILIQAKKQGEKR